MVVFTYQIMLRRRKGRGHAKQDLQCQLSSCQGNERGVWRRGQTPFYSKSRTNHCTRTNKAGVILLMCTYKCDSVHWTLCLTKNQMCIWSSRYSLDFQTDDDLNRYTKPKTLYCHAGKYWHQRYFICFWFAGLKRRISRSKWNASGELKL